MNNNSIFSEMAKKITPYQWATGVSSDVLRFDTNTLSSPPPSVISLIRDLKKNCPVNEYNDPSYKKLKKLIAKYEGVVTEMITITNSGDEALDVIAKAFLNPGDFFVIQPPTYEIFKSQCEINNGIALNVPLLPEDFAIDLKNLLKTIRENPAKITFICNPNNPTGTVTSSDIIATVAKNTKGVVVVDEAYREFYGISSVPLIAKYPNIVVLRSFSKFGAMAGARVGYLIANKKISQVFDAIRFPLGVSMFSAKLAELLLRKDLGWIKKQVAIINRERTLLTKNIVELGFKVYPSQSNFILVNFGGRASEIADKLKQKKVLIRDRSKKNYLQGCARITVRSPEQNMILIRKLKEII